VFAGLAFIQSKINILYSTAILSIVMLISNPKTVLHFFAD